MDYTLYTAYVLRLLLVGLLVWATNGITEDFYGHKNGTFPLLMPNVKPHSPELYLCSAVKVDSSTSYYIISYEPNAQMHTAHHIVIYGCEKPGAEELVWNCGEMLTKEKRAPPCGLHTPSQILYAWARDAPKLLMPEGVGFKIGKDSPIKYVVLQVHYASISKFADGSTDDSGIFLDYTTEPLHKLAGILMLGAVGYISPRTTEYMETACRVNEHKILHPFAFRVHTHSLGKVVSGYRVRRDESGQDQWTSIGKRDPLTPQMFYPTENSVPIEFGDIVAARCTMESNRDRITETGVTNDDEMCNLYLMYYVENDEPLRMKYCFSEGAPTYYWNNSNVGLNNIPHYEASHL